MTRYGSYLFVLFLPAWAALIGYAQAPPAYTITTIAGQLGQPGNYSGDGGPAINAFLSGPSDLILDSSGNIYISDSVNNRIRQVNSSELINTIIGNGTGGYLGDGSQASSSGVELQSPTGLVFDSHGNLYIADFDNFVVRMVNSSGVISTVAGDNSLGPGFTGDLGPATSAQLAFPSSVAVDAAGNMYIADPDNNVVRVVCANQAPIACKNLPAGYINTFAGNYAEGASYTGDGGPATQALLNNPVAVLIDPAGNLYISDNGNNVIRRVTPGGIINTFAGNGTGNAGYSGDGGPATQALLNAPKGMGMDSSGNLYIADTDNCVIRMVEANGNIATIAGNRASGCGDYGDGGPALAAELNFPSGVAAYGGRIYVSDYSNEAIRLLTPPAEVPQVNAGGTVNGASYAAPVVPGSIADVFGDFYLSSSSYATGVPLNTSLQNLSFDFGGTQAPLFFASGGQVNMQVPWELAGQTSVTISATLNGTTGGSQTVSIAPYAPAIFTLNAEGTGAGAILDSNYNLISSSNPAIAGTTYLLIYCTGLGAVTSNQPATGAAASSALASTAVTPTVTIGGVSAEPAFSGLAPGYVGLYQVNVQVPAGVSSGSAVPVTITMAGAGQAAATSNMVTIVVQ